MKDYEVAKKLFRELVNKHGIGDELDTFQLCSDYGCSLADSSIDKIEICDDGRISFVYNENTGDYNLLQDFTLSELNDFYNQIKYTIENEEY